MAARFLAGRIRPLADIRAVSLIMENSQRMDALVNAHAIAPGVVKLSVCSSLKGG